MAASSRLEIIHAYRNLFKISLRAVQYSKPARFVVRDRMRNAFRLSGAEPDVEGIDRTLRFLDGAGRSKGIEHKILKNLMHVWWERQKLAQSLPCVT